MASTVADAAGDIEKMDLGGDSDDEAADIEMLKAFTKLHGELKAEWDKGKSRSLNKIGPLLDQAKLLMAKLEAFLPKFGQTVGIIELTNIRTVLEIGAYYNLLIREPEPDIEQYTRYMAQLRNYYLDYSKVLSESPHKYELYCASLLYLLTENRVSDFHQELALILYPSDQVKLIQHKNPILFKTMKIAESLEDGRYSALDKKMSIPTGLDLSAEQDKLMKLEIQGDKAIHDSEICRYFLDKLIISYRPQIAETLERAYDRWPKKFALERLHFNSYEELEDFAAERRWISKDGENYSYETKNEALSVAAKQVIADSLHYAREMDQII